MVRFVSWKDGPGSSMRMDYKAAGGKMGDPLEPSYCKTDYRLYLDFTSFLTKVLFVIQNPIAFSYLSRFPSHLWSVVVSQSSLGFHELNHFDLCPF